MLKKVLIGLLGVSLIGLVIYGCGQVVENGNGGANTGSLLGRVYQIDGATPLSGVSVTVTGTTTIAGTNASGYFSILNVPTTDRAVVNFSATGYVPTSRIIEVQDGVASYVTANMAQSSTPTVLDAGTGGTATDANNGSVTINPNTLRDSSGNLVTGNVNVTPTSFDPTDSDQLGAFPGNFAGVVNGQEEPFKSFGFMDVSVQQNNQDLTLNSTAELEIPIPPSQAMTAPATMDAWYYDTEQGKWIQDGTFTKVDKGGGVYVYRKNVEHFSTWNADYLYEEAYKSGKVVDEEGNPVAGATVVAEGVLGGWRNETTTDSNGEYTLAVEPGTLINEYARMGTQVSATTQETTPPAGQTIDVPDLVLAAPLVTITLVWGANPRDLDSHLTGPSSISGPRFHCYFGRLAPANSNASLDIDYVSGYGPEHTILTALREGTYRFCVHLYAGVGTIATSEAIVRLDVPTKGIVGRTFTPPTQASTLEVWRVFDLIVNASGNVSVSTLGDYAAYSQLTEEPFYITPGAFGAAALPKKKK
jgi:hypothetical protein